ncbi:MAG: hypothetical protein ACJ76Z_05770 [Thermoleophilaceae bacterium]
MTRVAVAVAALSTALLATAAGHGATQGKLKVSMSDDFQLDPVVVVAEKPVTLIGQAFVLFSDEACATGIAPGTVFHAQLTLPPEVSLRDGASPAQDVALGEGRQVVRFSWPAIASHAGLYNGRLDVSAQAKGGTECSGTHNFQIVAARGRPQFAVASGVAHGKTITVPVVAQLPALPNNVQMPDRAAAGATTEVHGSHTGGRDLADTLQVFGRTRLRRVFASLIDNGYEVTCIDYGRPRGFSRGLLRYRFRFTWNREMGMEPVLHSGHVRVGRRAVSQIQKACLSFSGR